MCLGLKSSLCHDLKDFISLFDLVTSNSTTYTPRHTTPHQATPHQRQSFLPSLLVLIASRVDMLSRKTSAGVRLSTAVRPGPGFNNSKVTVPSTRHSSEEKRKIRNVWLCGGNPCLSLHKSSSIGCFFFSLTIFFLYSFSLSLLKAAGVAVNQFPVSRRYPPDVTDGSE